MDGSAASGRTTNSQAACSESHDKLALSRMGVVKAAIKLIPVVGPLAQWSHSMVFGAWKCDPSRWIALTVRYPQAQIVQIGSNDGRTGDPIYRLLHKNVEWRGLFVEPVPYLFKRLLENYSDRQRFQFANVAINDGKPGIFYFVDQLAREHFPNLPAWFDQLGSFDRSHITRHLEGQLDLFIVEQPVEGTTLDNLLSDQNIERIDILHVDTEGHDWNILSQLDLERFSPEVILYENKHLSADDGRSAIEFLSERYDIFEQGADRMAIRRDRSKPLRWLLASLRVR